MKVKWKTKTIEWDDDPNGFRVVHGHPCPECGMICYCAGPHPGLKKHDSPFIRSSPFDDFLRKHIIHCETHGFYRFLRVRKPRVRLPYDNLRSTEDTGLYHHDPLRINFKLLPSTEDHFSQFYDKLKKKERRID